MVCKNKIRHNLETVALYKVAFDCKGGSGKILAMKDCWNTGQEVYDGWKSWTKNGKPCQSWQVHFPHLHKHHIDTGPYCR